MRKPKNPHAIRYSDISFREVLDQNLQAMDAQAMHHCMDQKIDIIIFNCNKISNIARAIAGERIGTRVSSDRKAS